MLGDQLIAYLILPLNIFRVRKQFIKINSHPEFILLLSAGGHDIITELILFFFFNYIKGCIQQHSFSPCQANISPSELLHFMPFILHISTQLIVSHQLSSPLREIFDHSVCTLPPLISYLLRMLQFCHCRSTP